MVRPAGTFVWFKGNVLNLSASGMMLHCATTLQDRQLLELELTTTDDLGKKHLRKLKAEIMWKKNLMYGLKFLTKANAAGKKS
jgi:PilZ domain